jgi:hypothetical protein
MIKPYISCKARHFKGRGASLIKICPFLFEMFSFEIFQYFCFLIFQNMAIQAKIKWLNLIFLVKPDISKVWRKFNLNRPVCYRKFFIFRDVLIWKFSIIWFSIFSKYDFTSGKKWLQLTFLVKPHISKVCSKLNQNLPFCSHLKFVNISVF